MKSRLSLILLAIASFWGCSEEIEIAGPYEETIAVYGLLNADRAVPNQYIRISKAFLGEGNVYLMAQQQDSITLSSQLQVTMEKLLGGQVVESFPLTRIDTIPKDSGIFAYPGQVIYSMDRPLDDSTGALYRIRAKNGPTGTEVTSTTAVIPRMVVTSPVSTASADFATRLQITYKFRKPFFATIFDMEIVFRYREINSSGTTFYREITIPFTERGLEPDTLAEIGFKYYRPDFFSTVGPVITRLTGNEQIVYRRCDSLPGGRRPIEYRFFCGTEDLNTYYQLTRPSNGIVQERPLFTTVQNGVGLFTSRLTHSEFRDFDVRTKAAFDTSAFTRNLNFEFGP
ncbi:MAG: hypothetical protein RL213_637 [Bacteroidota bacterium]|jgi:hypothetical protein